jgi:hypothetical protein
MKSRFLLTSVIVFSAFVGTLMGGVCGVRAQEERLAGEEQASSAAVPAAGQDAGASGTERVISVNKDKDLGASHSAPVSIGAMKGIRGLAESAQMKKWLKGLITAEVPVMFQTMMMVENGAATGFMGSMQTISGMMDNQIQAAQLEMRMKDVLDPTGADTIAFVKAVPRGMKETGKDLAWPAGLIVASGDGFDTVPIKPQAKVEITGTPRPANIDDATRNNDDPAAGAAGGASGTSPEKLFTEILFSTPASGAAGTADQELKQFIVNYIGDIQFTETIDSAARAWTTKKNDFLPPSKTPGNDVTGIYSEASGQIPEEIQAKRAFQLRFLEHRSKVWKAWYDIFGKYCKFKADNDNLGQKIFDKVGPFSKVLPGDRVKASANDMKLTNNIIDRFFKIYVQTTNKQETTKITCDFEGKTVEATMPADSKPADAKIDDCERQPKKCNRNKHMLIFVEKIALSKTIDEFRERYAQLMQKAMPKGNFFLIDAERLFCHSLQQYTIAYDGSGTCEPLDYLERKAYENQESWLEEIEKLGQRAQGIGGSNSLKGSAAWLANVGPSAGGD